MLRISVLNGPRTTRLKLEGKLAHEWVSEAEKAWSAVAFLNGSFTSRRKKLKVDLLGVSFVDDAGRRLLTAMHRSGAELQGSGPMISALIEEIQKAGTEAANGSTADLRYQHGKKAEAGS
jgi:ABC-type transporter Mla MlaB component